MEEEESELTEFFFLNLTFCFALLSFFKKKIKKFSRLEAKGQEVAYGGSRSKDAGRLKAGTLPLSSHSNHHHTVHVLIHVIQM